MEKFVFEEILEQAEKALCIQAWARFIFKKSSSVDDDFEERNPITSFILHKLNLTKKHRRTRSAEDHKTIVKTNFCYFNLKCKTLDGTRFDSTKKGGKCKSRTLHFYEGNNFSPFESVFMISETEPFMECVFDVFGNSRLLDVYRADGHALFHIHFNFIQS